MRVQVYLHNNWGISTVGAGVEGRGAGLAVRDVGGAEEVGELGQQVVSVVRAVRRDIERVIEHELWLHTRNQCADPRSPGKGWADQ